MFDIKWIPYELKSLKRMSYERRKGESSVRYVNKYAGKKTSDVALVNKKIYDAIINEKPFFVGRVGGNEMNMMAYTYRDRYFPFRTDARRDCLRDLCLGAGFFPNELEYGEKFVDLMVKSMEEIDLIGIWARYMEEWFIQRFAPNTDITWLHNLEPWNLSEGTKWTYALEGKKVLVIHPFEDSIQSQYQKYDKLFENIDAGLLPKFELKTIKAVQSMGGHAEGFATWFDAYNYMLDKIKETEFDVAILGCGAYGFPLAADIKRIGKCAIHLGGVSQLLFGIQGKRWDSYGGVYENMVNEHWIRPFEYELSDIIKKTEDGCYC